MADGTMLFLLHLVSKMRKPEDGGSRIPILPSLPFGLTLLGKLRRELRSDSRGAHAIRSYITAGVYRPTISMPPHGPRHRLSLARSSGVRKPVDLRNRCASGVAQRTRRCTRPYDPCNVMPDGRAPCELTACS